MINLEELRLGNYVIDDGSPVKITRPFMVYLLERKVSDIEPIELTHGLLEKCGFVRENAFDGVVWDYTFNGKVRLTGGEFCENDEWVSDFVFNWWQYMDKASDMQCDIKHLHQLQNLVFVLTGSELPITL